ncbi:unnamed protein product [Blepharisma stoltei]|uniref:Uncharacterized protein n=1 Tax=Blepharisma stoltei TaxID=1481888 RepID=A0AAU9JL64_9CILI|nr:unnamed protein product [Blepharisma stoltei]
MHTANRNLSVDREHEPINESGCFRAYSGKNRDTINNWVKALNPKGLKFVDRMVLDINRRELLKQELESRSVIIEQEETPPEYILAESNGRYNDSTACEEFSPDFKRQPFNDSNNVFTRLSRDANIRKSMIELRDHNKELLEEENRIKNKKTINKEKLKLIIDRLNSTNVKKEESIRIAKEEREKFEIEEAIRLANLHHQRKPDPKVMERLTEEDKIIEKEYGIHEEVRSKSAQRSLSLSESRALGDRLMKPVSKKKMKCDGGEKETKKATSEQVENIVARLYYSRPSTPTKVTSLNTSISTSKGKKRRGELKESIFRQKMMSANSVQEKLCTPIHAARKNNPNTAEKQTNRFNEESSFTPNLKTPVKIQKKAYTECKNCEKELKKDNFPIHDIPKLNFDINPAVEKRSVEVQAFSDLKLSPIDKKSHGSFSFLSVNLDWPNSTSHHHKSSSIGQLDFKDERTSLSNLLYSKKFESNGDDFILSRGDENNASGLNQSALSLAARVSDTPLLSQYSSICNENSDIIERKDRGINSEIGSSVAQSQDEPTEIPLTHNKIQKNPQTYSQETLYLMSNPLKAQIEDQCSPKINEKAHQLFDTYRFIVGITESGDFIYE